jgi:hypothetical protein
MNTQDEDDDGLQEVELLGRLNKLTERVQELELLQANHLQAINIWRNRAKVLTETRDNYILSNTGLQGINKEYRALNDQLRVIGVKAAHDRDKARAIAALLEAECAKCWGPVHSEVLDALRLGELLEDDQYVT